MYIHAYMHVRCPILRKDVYVVSSCNRRFEAADALDLLTERLLKMEKRGKGNETHSADDPDSVVVSVLSSNHDTRLRHITITITGFPSTAVLTILTSLAQLPSSSSSLHQMKPALGRIGTALVSKAQQAHQPNAVLKASYRTKHVSRLLPRSTVSH